jgi:hypothetical protein
MLSLRRHRRPVLFMSVGFFLRRGTPLHSTRTAIECNVGFVIHDNRAVHVDVGDVYSVHVHDGGVIEERAAAPFAAAKALAAVSKAVVDSAVEADMRAPVTAVPNVEAVVPSPVSRSPQQARVGSFHPSAGYPVVAIVVIPGPIAGSPHIAFAGANGLLVNGQGGWLDPDRDADANLR